MDESNSSSFHTTKGKSQLTIKYAGFQDFIIKHQIRKGENNINKEITNTRIGSKEDNIHGGSYNIPEKEYDLFLRLYARDILNTNKKEYYTEKQLIDTGPILIDIDLRHDYEIDERQYTNSHIDDLIDIYLDTLKEIFQFDDSTAFNIYVMQKPTVNRIKEKNCTKDGIHLIIALRTDRTTQKILRNKVIPLVSDTWSDLSLINSFDDVFDKGITDGTVNWQLYGSRKPNHDRYKLTRIYNITYDSTDDEIMRDEISLSKFDITSNINELSVRNENHPSLFYKSSFIKEREEFDRKNSLKKAGSTNYKTTTHMVRELHMMEDRSLSSIKTREELDMMLESFLESALQSHLDYDLKDAYDYVNILPPSYYESGSYLKWIKVGWCLKNIDNRLLIVWLVFSAKSSTFDYTSIPELCEKWRNFELRPNDGVTKRSLYHWAKTDAPEEYERIRKNSLDYHVEQSLKIGGKKDDKSGCSDSDLAYVLYQLCKQSYVCTGIKNNTWMQYKNHRWCTSDSGTTLRKTISSKLRELYRNKAVSNMHTNQPSRNRTDDDEPIAEQEELQRVIQQRAINISQKLGQTSDKDHIMKEVKEFFYDDRFLEKLDTNPYLLCCKNGVFDFKEKIFRNGIPEDNLSISTNINYRPIDPVNDKKVIDEINEFMTQLFPDKELCRYMWEHLASTVIGTTPNQTFNNYIGVGQNGKSVLVNLMEIVLGDYKGDVPLTLVTDKRAKAGSAQPEMLQLKGKRYVVMQEPSKGDAINEGMMKALTSGKDTLSARGLYMSETIPFMPQFKMVVTCNVLMKVNSNDHGTWRRIMAVPFESLFTDNPIEGDKEKPYQYKIDRNIDEKFDSWKEVFLSMLIDIACKTQGLVKPCDKVLEKSREYQQSQDYLSAFINECVLQSNNSSFIEKAELKNEFIRWYELNVGNRIPSPKELNELMDQRFGKSKNSKWYGVKINYESNDSDNEDDVIENSLRNNDPNGL